MNIFATHDDTRLCALALDDRRVNKMIIETAQLLSTVIRRNDPGLNDLLIYSTSHVNHPCEIWARNPNNFSWLLEHGLDLCWVKFRHVGGNHKTFATLTRIVEAYQPPGDSNQHTEFPNCTPHKDIRDVQQAYRLTMNEKWDREIASGYTPTWYGRKPPEWRIQNA